MYPVTSCKVVIRPTDPLQERWWLNLAEVQLYGSNRIQINSSRLTFALSSTLTFEGVPLEVRGAIGQKRGGLMSPPYACSQPTQIFTERHLSTCSNPTPKSLACTCSFGPCKHKLPQPPNRSNPSGFMCGFGLLGAWHPWF